MESPFTTPARGPARGLVPPPAVTAPALLGLRTLFDRAVETAVFILGDRERALHVAVEAVAKLHVAARAQKRRRAYRPKGRLTSEGAGRATRTRVSAEESHLLQRLIYVETERWEREQERAGRVDARDLLLRYVKHLVRIGLKRNSFYTVLGLSRLLYRYSTIETMEIYSLVIQDPDRVRDDHYYRARKKQMLEEVLGRFDGLLQLENGPRGEHRIRTRVGDGEARAFIDACLRRFIPWDTRCVVPERFDPWSDEIADLCFRGTRPDDEHPIETNRFHATIDPECYARLVAALSLAPPGDRLALPEFDMPKNESPREGSGSSRPSEDGEFGRAQERWADDARRRRQSNARVLAIVADGLVLAHLDLDEASHARVRVPAGTELVEVKGADGETLAVWLAGFETPALRSSAEYAVRLENGREIVIRRDRPDDLQDFDLEIACREAPGVWSRLAGLWARVREALLKARSRPVWTAIAVCALAAVASLWPPTASRVTPPPAPTSGVPDPSLTRGGSLGLTLAEVRRVYVDRVGDGHEASSLRDQLVARLAASARFQIAARHEAQAVLRATRDAHGAIAVELVSPTGRVLWHATRAVPSAEQPAATAAAIVDALLEEARKTATASRP